jgi:hypothetical protein
MTRRVDPARLGRYFLAFSNYLDHYHALRSTGVLPMAGTERQREIRRRRSRRKKVAALIKKAKGASGGVKSELARKLRMLTPGAEVIIGRLGIKA